MEAVLSEEEALTDVNNSCNKASQQYGRCEHMRAIIEMMITDIETHEKYRVIKLLQAFAEFLDNGAFMSLAIVIFIRTHPNDTSTVPSDETVQTQIIENPVLFSVFLFDALYAVLSSKVHIWMFKRSNLYTLCILNLIYMIIFSIRNYWNPLIVTLYTLRVFGFLYELFTLYCWDLEIAYDLSNKQITELWRCGDYNKICTRCNNQSTERLFNRTSKSNDDQYIIIMHETRVFYFKCNHTDCDIVTDEYIGDDSYGESDNILQFPDGCKYCGSICSWTFINVFNWIPVKEDNDEKYLWHWLTRWFMRIMIATIPLLLQCWCFIVASLVSFVGYLIVTILNCCKGCKKADYKSLMIGEMIHEKSI